MVVFEIHLLCDCGQTKEEVTLRTCDPIAVFVYLIADGTLGAGVVCGNNDVLHVSDVPELNVR
jgi:hypothetical protein